MNSTVTQGTEEIFTSLKNCWHARRGRKRGLETEGANERGGLHVCLSSPPLTFSPHMAGTCGFPMGYGGGKVIGKPADGRRLLAFFSYSWTVLCSESAFAAFHPTVSDFHDKLQQVSPWETTLTRSLTGSTRGKTRQSSSSSAGRRYNRGEFDEISTTPFNAELRSLIRYLLWVKLWNLINSYLTVSMLIYLILKWT